MAETRHYRRTIHEIYLVCTHYLLTKSLWLVELGSAIFRVWHGKPLCHKSHDPSPYLLHSAVQKTQTGLAIWLGLCKCLGQKLKLMTAVGAPNRAAEKQALLRSSVLYLRICIFKNPLGFPELSLVPEWIAIWNYWALTQTSRCRNSRTRNLNAETRLPYPPQLVCFSGKTSIGSQTC